MLVEAAAPTDDDDNDAGVDDEGETGAVTLAGALVVLAVAADTRTGAKLDWPTGLVLLAVARGSTVWVSDFWMRWSKMPQNADHDEMRQHMRCEA